jgi:hypothetical protein
MMAFIPIDWWELFADADNEILRRPWMSEAAQKVAHEILAYRLCQELGL